VLSSLTPWGLKVILFTLWVDVGGGGKRVYEGGQQEGRVTERERERGKASSFYCLLALSFARLPKMEEREREINPESPLQIRVMMKHD
jgi:hypothetical protein